MLYFLFLVVNGFQLKEGCLGGVYISSWFSLLARFLSRAVYLLPVSRFVRFVCFMLVVVLVLLLLLLLLLL